MQLTVDRSFQERKKHGSFQFPIMVSKETITDYEAESFAEHWHSEIEITLVTDGEMLYSVNHQTIFLQRGDLIFCNSGALHSGRSYRRGKCEYISVTFDSKLIYGFENSAVYEKYVAPILKDISSGYLHFQKTNETTGELERIVRELTFLIDEKKELYEMEMLHRLQRIWKIIYKNHPKKSLKIDAKSRDLVRLRSLIAYIEMNYAERITLSDLANHIQMCESECCRLFKRIMKQTIFEYLNMYRIKKAAILLQETTSTIGKISERTGFYDANQFSKIFKREMGSSPSDFRKKIMLSMRA